MIPETPTVGSLLGWNSQTAIPLVTRTMSDTSRNRGMDR